MVSLIILFHAGVAPGLVAGVVIVGFVGILLGIIGISLGIIAIVIAKKSTHCSHAGSQ